MDKFYIDAVDLLLRVAPKVQETLVEISQELQHRSKHELLQWA